MNDTKTDLEVTSPEQGYDLLDLTSSCEDVTIRDEHYDFFWLVDAVRLCRKKGCRFRLIDSGLFDRFRLDWLLLSGAQLYTADDVDRPVDELRSLVLSARKGKGIIAVFIHGKIGAESAPNQVSNDELSGLARSGLYLHITNRELDRDIRSLCSVAHDCRQNGSWLVYYHHGNLDAALAGLVENGSCVHLSDFSLTEDQDYILFRDLLAVSRTKDIPLVLHVEKAQDPSILDEFLREGAHLVFKSGLIDYKSPLKPLYQRARKRHLDHRAYYLYNKDMP